MMSDRNTLLFGDHKGSYDPVFDHYFITGNVRNDNGSPMSTVIVVGTLYDNHVNITVGLLCFVSAIVVIVIVLRTL
jgi:hypothetical protein